MNGTPNWLAIGRRARWGNNLFCTKAIEREREKELVDFIENSHSPPVQLLL